MKNYKQKLQFSGVKSSLKVIDNKGNIGLISESDHDIHNIEVDYLQGGAGLYCIDTSCDQYDPLYIYTE